MFFRLKIFYLVTKAKFQKTAKTLVLVLSFYIVCESFTEFRPSGQEPCSPQETYCLSCVLNHFKTYKNLEKLQKGHFSERQLFHFLTIGHLIEGLFLSIIKLEHKLGLLFYELQIWAPELTLISALTGSGSRTVGLVSK